MFSSLTPTARAVFFAIMVVSAALIGWPARAQTDSRSDTPTTQQMVDQLKPKPARTRSLRNLEVESAPPPSLSLQIQFDFNSARVSPVSQQALKNLAEAMQSPELKSASFSIEGHSDAKGKAEYNLKLSQSRAEAVRDFLMMQLVDAQRLKPVGKGSTEPVNLLDPTAAENRRVRIVNLITR